MSRTPSLAFAFIEPHVWNHIPIEDPQAREVYDRHYSRQTPGANGILAPGERFLLWHEDDAGKPAIWGVVRNYFRDAWRWRNSIFRNESSTLSSDLIKAATDTTYHLWQRRYLKLPDEPLTTEIDIEATRARRSKRAAAGVCYFHAGWTWLRDTPREHGRSPKSIWQAPRP